MENNDPKQLIIERVKQATNILVTVESSPSVDELAAALALTLMLNKMDKHATAVFSGSVPPAINFLEPSKTFENTVDSLRDFIIALDKEKADRLRYKVVDDMVKIFITPYQSTITEKDLHFSQGDFNVEVVIALGVEQKDSLDRAIAAHGRILHDATVITINARDEHSSLGMIDWQDGKASSICEMLVSLSDALQPKLLDAQISTALLTGIVAATDRFSNEHTAAHVMTIAAELMAAGANPQLIANNLQQTAGRSESEKVTTSEDIAGKINRETATPEGSLSEESKKVDKPAEPSPPSDGSKGEMKVRHEEEAEEKPAESSAEVPKPEGSVPTTADELGDLSSVLKSAAETPPQPSGSTAVPVSAETPPQAPSAPESSSPVTPPSLEQPQVKPIGQNLESSRNRPNWQRLEPPTLGGTLNATTAEAEEARRLEAEEEQKHNNITLTHDRAGSGIPSTTITPPSGDAFTSTPPPTMSSAVTSPSHLDELPPLPPLQSQPAGPITPPAPTPVPESPAPTPTPTPAPNDSSTDHTLEEARQAVNEALAGQSFGGPPAPSVPPAPTPAPAEQLPSSPPTPVAPSAGNLPPMPDFSTLPPLPPMPDDPQNGSNPMVQSNIAPGTDVTAQFVPPNNTVPGPALPPTQQPPVPPAPGQVASDQNNPNQFQIPGQ